MRKGSANVYKAEYDADNCHNDAPVRCSMCGHRYFRVYYIGWICDKCETVNPPDTVRAQEYRRKKTDLMMARARKRGKKKVKREAMEFDGLI